MKTMMRTLLVAAGLIGAGSAVQANAATFNFTYTLADGNILGGSFNGALAADGNTFTTAAAATDKLTYNGATLTINPNYYESYTAFSQGGTSTAGGAILTLDGSVGDFIYYNGDTGQGADIIVNAGFGYSNGKNIGTFGFSGLRDKPFVAANFRANVAGVAAVPEPATWAMMLVGFGLMGTTMRYRRRSITTVYA